MYIILLFFFYLFNLKSDCFQNLKDGLANIKQNNETPIIVGKKELDLIFSENFIQEFKQNANNQDQDSISNFLTTYYSLVLNEFGFGFDSSINSQIYHFVRSDLEKCLRNENFFEFVLITNFGSLLKKLNVSFDVTEFLNRSYSMIKISDSKMKYTNNKWLKYLNSELSSLSDDSTAKKEFTIINNLLYNPPCINFIYLRFIDFIISMYSTESSLQNSAVPLENTEINDSDEEFNNVSSKFLNLISLAS